MKKKIFCYKSLHYILFVWDVHNENHELTNTDFQYLTMVDISDTKFIYIKRTGHFKKWHYNLQIYNQKIITNLLMKAEKAIKTNV